MAELFLLKRLSLARNIVAATSLLHEIYVITENSVTVDVYFCHRPYQLKNRVAIGNMASTDIATSYADVSVYALDSRNVCIWRIHRKLKKTTKHALNIGPEEVLKSMSITKSGAIVVVLSGNGIVLYNPVDGKTARIYLEGASLSKDGIAHAAEFGDGCLLACNGTQMFVYDLKREEVCKAMNVCGNHIALKNSKTAVITDKIGQQLRMLDMETWETTEVNVRRNGLWGVPPSHVHCAMENGLLLVAWKNYLHVYSFDELDLESHLADTDTAETRNEAASSQNAVGVCHIRLTVPFAFTIITGFKVNFLIFLRITRLNRPKMHT